MWYAHKIDVQNSIFETMSRDGIWYTKSIVLTNCTLQAPKLFRRCQGVTLNHVQCADAKETLWTCRDLTMENCRLNEADLALNAAATSPPRSTAAWPASKTRCLGPSVPTKSASLF